MGPQSFQHLQRACHFQRKIVPLSCSRAANYNLTKNAYTYVDLEKTTGGEVKENWRWNVGMRYVW